MNIHKAILKINSNAQFTINANDINQITWLNGTVPISKEDIEAMIPVVEQELKDAEANKIAKKQSAIAKLTALGLDEEEVKAIIGA